MLTDTKIRNLKRKKKLYRIADSHGLALEINPNEIRALNNISSIYLKQTEPLVKKSNDLDINQTKLYNKYEKEIDELFFKALPYLETLVKLQPSLNKDFMYL